MIDWTPRRIVLTVIGVAVCVGGAIGVTVGAMLSRIGWNGD